MYIRLFHFGSENKDFLKFLQLKWGKKMTCKILQYLDTPHHQAFSVGSQ